MDNKIRVTLKDWNSEVNMDFLTLEYLDDYFKWIDITKVKVHEILWKKLFFIYEWKYYSCPLYRYDDLLIAMATCNLFLSQMIYDISISSK